MAVSPVGAPLAAPGKGTMGFALTYTTGYYAAIATVYYLANGRYKEAACWVVVLAVACLIFYHNEKGQHRRY